MQIADTILYNFHTNLVFFGWEENLDRKMKRRDQWKNATGRKQFFNNSEKLWNQLAKNKHTKVFFRFTSKTTQKKYHEKSLLL